MNKANLSSLSYDPTFVMEINETKQATYKDSAILYTLAENFLKHWTRGVENYPDFELVKKEGTLINSGDNKCCQSDLKIIKGDSKTSRMWTHMVVDVNSEAF